MYFSKHNYETAQKPNLHRLCCAATGSRSLTQCNGQDTVEFPSSKCVSLPSQARSSHSAMPETCMSVPAPKLPSCCRRQEHHGVQRAGHVRELVALLRQAASVAHRRARHHPVRFLNEIHVFTINSHLAANLSCYGAPLAHCRARQHAVLFTGTINSFSLPLKYRPALPQRPSGSPLSSTSSLCAFYTSRFKRSG